MKDRATTTPGIPDIRDDNIADILRALKSTTEVREGRSGDPQDAFVTLRHLTDLGLATKGETTKTNTGDSLPVGVLPGFGGGTDYNPNTDLSTPPAPTNLRVSGGFVAIYLEWDGAPYHNHAYTEVWRSATDSLGTARMVGTAIMSGYADPVEPDSTYYYWIRFHSQANVVGPYNSTTGTMGHTAMDIGKAIEALSTELTNSALWQSLSQRIDKIQGDQYIANRGINSTLTELTNKIGAATGRILELNNVNETQATSLKLLESRGPGNGNAIYFTPDRPDAATPGFIAGLPLNAGDIWYDTNDDNRSYRWSGTAWIEFTTAGAKVYHQPTDPASFNGTNWVDVNGRIIREGDLWYDSDSVPPNHPYRWSSITNTWLDFASGDNSADIITLEQTKIGVAVLNVNSPFGPAGAVFDNSGAIWNNAPSGDPDYSHSVQFWNSTHVDNAGTDSKLTWHIGIPFAQSTKQVGISADGGNTVGTVQQQFTAMKTTDDGLLLQYTVKLDANGYVSGFGLASTVHNAVPQSMFLVSADAFAIGPAFPATFWGSGTNYQKNDTVKMNGGNPVVTHVFQSRQANNLNHPPVFGAYKAEVDPWWVDLTARLPFITTTSTTVIDGKTYPPGVWMNTANIADATIQNAQIGSLTADKITAGTIFAAVSISTAGYIYGGVVPGQPMASATYGNGFFMGGDGGVIKFYVGNTDIGYAMWDGSQFKVQGLIIGTAGSIGGINMSATKPTSAQPVPVGQLYTNGVSGVGTGTQGFWLDSTGKMRIGNPTGSRMVWDGTNISIYGPANNLVLQAGSIDWNAIPNVPPSANTANISINANGTLNNAGGGQVTPTGIQAIRTDGSNAPPTLVNANVVLSGASGTIALTGGTGQVTQVVMPGFRIGEAGPTSTFIADAAINTAQIANLAVGGAQISVAAISTAHIGDAQVQTLKINGDAVTVPSAAFWNNQEIVTYTETVLFGGDFAPVQFPLDVTTQLIEACFTTELVQSSGNNGAVLQVNCYLDSNTRHFKQTFNIGIINNQPAFSQSAVFAFTSLPADSYWMHISAQQISGGANNNQFNKKALTVTAYKR